MLWTIILGLPGSIALFVIGMQKMSQGLQKAAGEKLRQVLKILTINSLIGTITGIVVTVLLQSSSTVTVMVVGFVNAGLLNLFQAISIILGANVGTTVTAQIVSFRVHDIALPAIALGFLIHFLFEKKFYRYLGESIIGFGILFLGMQIMLESLYPLREYPFFIHIMASLGDLPIFGLMVGALFTLLIQSSSAASGVIIALTLQGLLDLSSGLALVLGTNLGTCVTAFLASIGTNITARRAALAHFMFNFLGALLFLLFLNPFTSLVLLTAKEVPRQVANGHTLFNLLSAVLFLPFLKNFTSFIEKILPGEEKSLPEGPRFLEEGMLETPAVAIDVATREIIFMGEISLTMVEEVTEGFLEVKRTLVKRLEEKEKVINQLELDITSYLSRLTLHSLTDIQSKRVTRLMHTINDVERIGDHVINVLELLLEKEEKGLSFSEKAIEDLSIMGEEVRAFLKNALYTIEKEDMRGALLAGIGDDTIDGMERELRSTHIDRLNKGVCTLGSGVIFLDILSNLERIGDHSTNMAQSILEDYRR